MTRKHDLKAIVASCLAALFLVSAPSTADNKAVPLVSDPDFAVRMMQRVDDLFRGESSRGKMEMTVKTAHWKRTMKLESWSRGKDYSLVRILKPKKDKGTATLKAKKDLYIYLKKTDRTVKISSAMMGSAWMGSHFTNDDIVRHTRFDKDFKITLDFNGQEGEHKVYRFALVPNPDAAVVWGKIEVTIRQSDLMPLKQLFFDEEGKKSRVLKFSQFKKVGDRTIPTVLTMTPLDEPEEFTKITWRDLDFSVDLKPAFFSIQKLQSM